LFSRIETEKRWSVGSMQFAKELNTDRLVKLSRREQLSFNSLEPTSGSVKASLGWAKGREVSKLLRLGHFVLDSTGLFQAQIKTIENLCSVSYANAALDDGTLVTAQLVP
jgi:hypothetical protein